MTRKLRREAEVDTLLAKVIKRTAERVRCPPPLTKSPVESVGLISVAWLGFRTTYKTAGTAKLRGSRNA